MANKGKLIIDRELCKSCKTCIDFCPREGVIALDMSRVNAKGWNPLIVLNEEQCTSCALCALMCPDKVIEVYK